MQRTVDPALQRRISAATVAGEGFVHFGVLAPQTNCKSMGNESSVDDLDKTVSNGYLGSCNDDERSKLR